MTDSRVTPQAAAVEAAAKVMYADAGGILEGRWRYRAAEAERILAAAGPLLCQPLQDETDRLRAALLDAEHRLRLLTDRTGDYSPEGLRMRLANECQIIGAAAVREVDRCACGRADEHGPHE